MKQALHGTGPQPGEPRLLTRAELPSWVKPLYAVLSNTEIFFTDGSTIGQAVFMITNKGAAFLDLFHHTPDGRRRRADVGGITALRGCVLVAIGALEIQNWRVAHGRTSSERALLVQQKNKAKTAQAKRGGR